MFGNLDPPVFVISLTAVAFLLNFDPVKSLETTTLEVVDVEVVDATTQISAGSNTTLAPTTSYLCSNSFDIHSLQEFKEKVLNSTKPIIVQFHAPWSEPCQILSPRIGRAIDSKGGKLQLARVDIDKQEKVGLEVGIQIVPCIAAFRAGELIDKLTGLQEEENLKVFLGRFIVD